LRHGNFAAGERREEGVEVNRPSLPPGCLKPETMNDFIYFAVMAAVFLAAQLYAHWCGKL
jgi:hypothetical protein